MGSTVWAARWTADELAEKGVPCVCGHHSDEHRDGDEHPAPDTACACKGAVHDLDWLRVCVQCYESDDPFDRFTCAGYIPDRERLCERCRGFGGAPDDDNVPACVACNGAGWIA